MYAHTYTPHTSTSIHLLLQSHVYCLCKFVFPCSGNYQQVFLLPFALLNICMHMHMHTCTQTHMHMHAHSRTHTLESCFNHKRVHMYTLKWLWQSFITHTHTHMHTHTYTELASALQNYYLISLLSLVAMSTLTRCEPALQESTLMHTGMHAQARTHTNKHTHTYTSANHPLSILLGTPTLVPPPLEPVGP